MTYQKTRFAWFYRQAIDAREQTTDIGFYCIGLDDPCGRPFADMNQRKNR